MASRFRSVLIANRGEIAVRIIRACREAGLRSIAVYSDADARSLHVRLADEAHRIGPPPAVESYLNADAILEVASIARAEAIHPGYGFLAEQAGFAERCLAAGLVWIGPSPEAMRLLGDKAAARARAERIGVPILPGYHGAGQADATLRSAAETIGYPVLVKASAGGGGRGMRVVESPSELDTALAAARREAHAAFGDDRLLLERYLRRPRHVEMQIFGDAHGTVLYLGERDCSIQRRHQKVVEEAPAPRFTAAQRRDMGEAAVALARSATYASAGTAEFLLDESGEFYFLEMNTRLQVEHPVTELVTGLDLVQLQFKVAVGEPLGLAQEDLRVDGHAIECRLYAEDPSRDFLPSSGRLLQFRLPELRGDEPVVRIDRGVSAGDVVSPFYDPLLAKLVVHAADRAAAVDHMAEALAAATVVGVRTNLGFLRAVMASSDFGQGLVHTAFVEQAGLSAGLLPPLDLLAGAAAADLLGTAPGRAEELWSCHGSWRMGSVGLEMRYDFDGRLLAVAVEPGIGPEDAWTFETRGERIERRVRPIGQEPDGSSIGLRLELGAGSGPIWVARAGPWRVVRRGRETISLRVVSGLDETGRHTGPESSGTRDLIRSPMPGRIVKLQVQPGEAVRAGQTLLVLEAMKIEHLVTAPRDGLVEAVRFQEGDQVDIDAELVELED
jgi:3-methylcrotonyl-CoA carboxylase alpha subunit